MSKKQKTRDMLVSKILARVEKVNPPCDPLAHYVEGPCWVYKGATNSSGYGCVRDPQRKISTVVHRIIFSVFRTIPEGMVLDHLCRNRQCCNPVHLEIVTDKENRRRGKRSPKS